MSDIKLGEVKCYVRKFKTPLTIVSVIFAMLVVVAVNVLTSPVILSPRLESGETLSITKTDGQGNISEKTIVER